MKSYSRPRGKDVGRQQKTDLRISISSERMAEETVVCASDCSERDSPCMLMSRPVDTLSLNHPCLLQPRQLSKPMVGQHWRIGCWGFQLERSFRWSTDSEQSTRSQILQKIFSQNTGWTKKQPARTCYCELTKYCTKSININININISISMGDYHRLVGLRTHCIACTSFFHLPHHCAVLHFGLCFKLLNDLLLVIHLLTDNFEHFLWWLWLRPPWHRPLANKVPSNYF